MLDRSDRETVFLFMRDWDRQRAVKMMDGTIRLRDGLDVGPGHRLRCVSDGLRAVAPHRTVRIVGVDPAGGIQLGNEGVVEVTLRPEQIGSHFESASCVLLPSLAHCSFAARSVCVVLAPRLVERTTFPEAQRVTFLGTKFAFRSWKYDTDPDAQPVSPVWIDLMRSLLRWE